MLYQLTSIKEVIGRVIRNTRIQDTSYIADMKEWIPEAMGYMKTRMSLVHKSDSVDIHFHTGQFPCGLHTLTAVLYKGQRLPLRTSSCGEWYDTTAGGINTSLCDGTITVKYLSLPLDDEGFPLVPDNEDYKQAVYWYVREMMIGAGYDDKVYSADNCHQKFEIHAARAMGQIRYPSVDLVATRIPSITRFLPDNFVSYFGLRPDSDCGSDGLGAFGTDLTVNGSTSSGGNTGPGGVRVITETVVEHTTDIVYRNNFRFEYIALGTEGKTITVPYLVGKVWLELFLDSYLLREELDPSIAITPNSFRFDKSTGRLTFFNDFTPQQIVQGLYTTEV